jgi:hypothetical protein
MARCRCIAPCLGSAEGKESEFKEKLSNKSKWLRISLLHLRFNVEFEINIYTYYLRYCGPGSVVGITTGWTVRGSNPGGGEIFRTCPDWPSGLSSLLYNEYGVLPGVKSGRSVTLTSHLLLVPWSRKGRAIPPLPQWAVRPVQSLSALLGCSLPLPLLGVFVACQRTDISEDLLYWFVSYSSCNKLDSDARALAAMLFYKLLRYTLT